MLAFAAEHRIILAAQVQALLGVRLRTAQDRLRRLVAAQALDSEPVFHRRPACYWITGQGLGLAGRRYAPHGYDTKLYDHDVGVGWLWLAAQSGYRGAMREVISERQMRSSAAMSNRPVGPPDSRAAVWGGAGGNPGDPAAPSCFGIRTAAFAPSGRPAFHYPDVLLVTESGQRVALELELTGKGVRRLESILTGYALDGRVDVVLYLTDDRSIARTVEATAAKLAISSLVRTQRIALARAPGSRAPAAERVLRPAEPARNGEGKELAR